MRLPSSLLQMRAIKDAGDADCWPPLFPTIVKHRLRACSCRIHLCGCPQLSFIHHIPGIISFNSNHCLYETIQIAHYIQNVRKLQVLACYHNSTTFGANDSSRKRWRQQCHCLKVVEVAVRRRCLTHGVSCWKANSLVVYLPSFARNVGCQTSTWFSSWILRWNKAEWWETWRQR